MPKRPGDSTSQEDGANCSPSAKRCCMTEATAGNPATQEPAQESQPAAEPALPSTLHVVVKWTSITGRTKTTSLPLSRIETTADVKGLHKRLLSRAFQDREATRPSMLDSPCYVRFATNDECLNFPPDVATTDFKVVARDEEGWEFVVHETSQSASHTPNNEPKLHVTIIEFETIARIIGTLGIRMSMVAYPVIALHKQWLQDVARQMQQSDFKGIL